MSHSSIQRIEDIINPNSITNWYRMDSITANTNSTISHWYDSSGNNNHLLQFNTTLQPRFEIDSGGYKCLKFYSGNTMTSINNISYNNDETFIIVAKVDTYDVRSGAFVFFFRDFNNFNRVAISSNSSITAIEHQITDYTVGSGRIIQTIKTLDTNKNIIISQRKITDTPNFKVWNNFKSQTGSFTNTTYGSSSQWRLNHVTTFFEVKIYEMICINEYLDDNKVKLITRNLAFKNGLLL